MIEVINTALGCREGSDTRSSIYNPHSTITAEKEAQDKLY